MMKRRRRRNEGEEEEQDEFARSNSGSTEMNTQKPVINLLCQIKHVYTIDSAPLQLPVGMHACPAIV